MYNGITIDILVPAQGDHFYSVTAQSPTENSGRQQWIGSRVDTKAARAKSKLDACFDYREFALEDYLAVPLRWGTQYVVFIEPIFHNTVETWLKIVECGEYEQLKTELRLFAWRELANAL